MQRKNIKALLIKIVPRKLRKKDIAVDFVKCFFKVRIKAIYKMFLSIKKKKKNCAGRAGGWKHMSALKIDSGASKKLLKRKKETQVKFFKH